MCAEWWFSNRKHNKMHIRFSWLYCVLNSVEALGEILHRICAIASSTTHVICLQCFYIAIFCLAISPILFSNYNSELHLMAMRFSFLSIGGQFFNVFFTNLNYAIFCTFIIWYTQKKPLLFRRKPEEKK